jgi:hypothetical protein
MTANPEWIHASPELYPKYADVILRILCVPEKLP